MKRSITNCQIENYYVYERIDKGTYGSIYIGMDDDVKKVVAVKLLDLKEIEKDPSLKVR
jgi:predicted butyrate kinase (DUF1464 family)